MAFSCKLGSSGWDAVKYVRNLTEDATQPFTVSDDAYRAYVEAVNEEFSRFMPVDYIVGNPAANSSPVNTIMNQQRYVCSVGNGFSVPPIVVTDVLYRAGTGYSAASEIAYLAILPFSPLNRFLFTPNLLDSPSERVLRDEYLNELQHYGNGYYSTAIDPSTGLLSIDLYPIPVVANIPIFVRYKGAHTLVTDNTPDQNVTLATIPENFKAEWAKLLYCVLMEEAGDRVTRVRLAKAGLTEIQADSRGMEARINRIREEAHMALGGMAGQIVLSN